jgi:digeranylgeranylglycerophospholipid reductase
MENSFDIIVVGAGPAGLYFAWKIAEKNNALSVLVIEKRTEIGHHIDGFHFDSCKFAEFGIPEPQKDSPEFVTIKNHGNNRSPYGNYPKDVVYNYHVLRLPYYLKRLARYAQDARVKILLDTEYSGTIIEDGKLVGVVAKTKKNPLTEFRGKLIIDASGINAVVRRSLPDEYGMEKFSVAEDELFYVILKYINWTTEETMEDEGWTFYKTWVAPSPEGDAILGIGQPLSYLNGEIVWEKFLEIIKLPPYEVLKEERGSTPYRRPPFSLVADNYISLGDSACLTKPFSGEGITSGYTAAAIALDIVERAFISNDLSRENLWEINVRYFRDQGAKFAGMLAQIPAAANTTMKEMEYLFKKDVIFSAADFTSMHENFEIKLPLGKVIRIALVLVWGVLTGRYSIKNLKSLLGGMSISGKMREHYEKYPESPENFEEWVINAKELWSQLPKMNLSEIK